MFISICFGKSVSPTWSLNCAYTTQKYITVLGPPWTISTRTRWKTSSKYDETVPTLAHSLRSNFSQNLWVSILAYILATTLTKLSIVLQYMRLFPGRRMVLACRITLFLVILYGVTAFSMAVFSCFPDITSFWTTRRGCWNAAIQVISTSIFNILTDFLILLLPIPSISSLQLPQRQKLALMGIFALGGLLVLLLIFRDETLTSNSVTIVSFLRLGFLVDTSKSHDISCKPSTIYSQVVYSRLMKFRWQHSADFVVTHRSLPWHNMCMFAQPQTSFHAPLIVPPPVSFSQAHGFQVDKRTHILPKYTLHIKRDYKDNTGYVSRSKNSYVRRRRFHE